MRTVTFANLALVAYLKEHFVLVWHDQSGSWLDAGAQPSAETGDYPEGEGGGNLRTLWCLPDGRVFRYLEGYWGAQRYLAEVRQALQVFRDLTALPAARRTATVRAALDLQHLQAVGQRQRLLQQHPNPKAAPPAIQRQQEVLGKRADFLNVSSALVGRPVEPFLDDLRRQNALLGSVT
jgi:hypothetical protein